MEPDVRYSVMTRHEGLPGYLPAYDKLAGGHQFELVEDEWVELGRDGTYKNEPWWWLINGDEGFDPIAFADLPPGTPT